MKIKVRIWRISGQGKTLYATAEFSSREKALEWAVNRLSELFKRGSLGSIQIAV